METKRLILAIALSMVVIVGFQLLFSPKPAINNGYRDQNINKTNYDNTIVKQNNITKKSETKPTIIKNSADNKPKPEKQINNKDLTITKNDKLDNIERFEEIKTENFTAVFTNKGAGLKSYILNKEYNMDDAKPKKHKLDFIPKKTGKNYPILPFYFSVFDPSDINNEIYKEANNALYLTSKTENEDSIIISFEFNKGTLQVKKTFTIYKGTYVIGIDTKIINSAKTIPSPFIFGPELGNNLRASSKLYQLKAFNGSEVENETFKSMTPGYASFGRAGGHYYQWAAFDTTYYSVIFKFNTTDRDSKISRFVSEIPLPDGKKSRKNYIIATNPTMVFMGPKEERILERAGKRFHFNKINDVISYGWSLFEPIAKIMLKGINFIYEKILGFGNYGWAIVIFTIFLKLLLFPLTYKSSVSMAKMQTIQPKMKALKKKYKNQKDPAQRKAMNEELMALYKTEKVNPAGGCLPMLLQMPILFAFFMLLRNAINVRHEVWILWIKDLSMLDPLYVLPILMGVTQIILAKMSPSGGDPNQKKMMTYMMPIFITFIVMNLASGLTLYWFVSNLLQIGQQHYINKKIYQEKKETDKLMKAAKKKKGVKKI